MYIVYPSDETTEFLLEIPKRIIDKFGQENITLINVLPNDESYAQSLIEIEGIPDSSIIIFMGHGQDDKLWGAESDEFTKKPFITKSQSKIFSNKSVFLLSCNSNEFLRGTFSFSKIISSIGFGSLPTEMTEVENSRRLKEQGINQNIINMYRASLVELVSLSLCEMIESSHSFSQLSNNFLLRVNKKISQVVLDDTKSRDNRILADLLFQMKSEMIFI